MKKGNVNKVIPSVSETIDYQKLYGVSKMQFNQIKKDIMAELMPLIIDYANCADYLNDGRHYYPKTMEVRDLVKKEKKRRGSVKYKKESLNKAKEYLKWMCSDFKKPQKETEQLDKRKTA